MSHRNSAISNVAQNSHEDPVTMMSGTSLAPEEGKKKKKKPKLTKAEKTQARAQAKLEKSAEELRRSGAKFDYFLDRMEKWLQRHSSKLMELCKALDVEDEGAITYDEFKSCIFDLGSPCNTVECQLLCTLLDPNEQEAVEYIGISSGLSYIRERELTYEETDVRPSIIPSKRSFDHCPKCKLSLWDGANEEDFPRYMMLDLRLVTFDGTKEYPGHVKLLTHTHIPVKGVLDYIRQQTALLTTKLALFHDKSRRPEAMLHMDSTLEELGFSGGPVHQPECLTLYYDYVVEFTDCPILMCDHYF